MKATPALVLWLLLLPCLPAAAQESAVDMSEVLARRGEGVVTHALFDARVSRIPEPDRPGFLRDRRRLQELLNQLLLHAQLVVDARAAGLHEDPAVQARMRLAAEEELVKAWVQQFPKLREPADYEAMAREYYAVNRERFTTEQTLDLTHILVGMEERTEEEALELVRELHVRILADPAVFDDLVLQYSDDPSASSNLGRFIKVERGQMVKAFETAAFELEEGEISGPVKTVYGYHLIRLDATNPARAQSFEEVRALLVDRMRRQHEERVTNNYLTWLNQQEVEMTAEALEAMVARYFAEAGSDQTSGKTDSE